MNDIEEPEVEAGPQDPPAKPLIHRVINTDGSGMFVFWGLAVFVLAASTGSPFPVHHLISKA